MINKVSFLNLLLPFFLLFSKISAQTKEIAFYRKDIGMYFHFDKSLKREKISFKENWDFYFSLKNDSTALIEDIKKKVIQPPAEFKISSKIDSTFVKRYPNGKRVKTEKMYFRKLYL